MKSWAEFKRENPELAMIGRRLLVRSHPNVGYAFLATLRKDGAPRLHPVSIVLWNDRLYVLIPTSSPKCFDLLHDGRFALQAWPPAENEQNEEFYLAGCAQAINDEAIRQALIADTAIQVDEGELLFELLFDRVMYTRLENQGTPDEHPVHHKWRANG